MRAARSGHSVGEPDPAVIEYMIIGHARDVDASVAQRGNSRRVVQKW
jgi:hypothetical protein